MNIYFNVSSFEDKQAIAQAIKISNSTNRDFKFFLNDDISNFITLDSEENIIFNEEYNKNKDSILLTCDNNIDILENDVIFHFLNKDKNHKKIFIEFNSNIKIEYLKKYIDLAIKLLENRKINDNKLLISILDNDFKNEFEVLTNNKLNLENILVNEQDIILISQESMNYLLGYLKAFNNYQNKDVKEKKGVSSYFNIFSFQSSNKKDINLNDIFSYYKLKISNDLYTFYLNSKVQANHIYNIIDIIDISLKD